MFGSDPMTLTYQDSTTLNSVQSAIVEKAELLLYLTNIPFSNVLQWNKQQKYQNKLCKLPDEHKVFSKMFET